jgi:uncharacterized protein
MYTDFFVNAGKFKEDEVFIKDNLVLETMMGSHAYGCNNENSDYDIVAFFMDRHIDLFPQSYGKILGFDTLNPIGYKECKGEKERIVVPDKNKPCEGEWQSLTKFFKQAGLGGSPLMIETLFARRNFVTYGHNIGWMLRDNRRLFLSARTFHAFKGYSIGQLDRIGRGFKNQKSDNLSRQIFIEKFGYDVKMAYHLLRLLDEIDQMLTTNDIDLQRNNTECLCMRAGEWGSFEKLESYCASKLLGLEGLLVKGVVPTEPQSAKLHQLLNNCIEQFYGTHDNVKGTEYVSAKEIKEQLDRIEKKMGEE